MEDGVGRESCGTARGINEGFIFPRVEHLDAHVDEPAWREVLPLFAFGRLVDYVFRGIVSDVKIGVEQLPFFQ